MATRYALKQIKEARNGDPVAQLWVGRNYLEGGEGLAPNLRGALQWLERAAKAGLEESERMIAEKIPAEIGAESSEYARICERVAARGSAIAYSRLGDLFEKLDRKASARAFLAAARQGHVDAAMKLGLHLADHPDEAADMREDARHWLELAAAAGRPEAAKRLADLLWDAKDPQVRNWLEPVAQGGDLEAMYRLGVLLAVATSTPEDVRRGASWLEKAARRGHPRAIWSYGRLHARALSPLPSGIPNSLIQAARLLERAAALGVAEAYLDLARIYRMDNFSRHDLAAARRYTELAAHAGLAEAEFAHGRHLARHGNDHAAWLEAGKWLSRAAAKGWPQAEQLLRRISDKPPELTETVRAEQDRALSPLIEAQPLIAARLKLAATFGLTKREVLFLDPLEAYEEWCLKIDLSSRFDCRPWRLVAIETDSQRRTLEAACKAFMQFGAVAPDLRGETTKIRSRQLHSILKRFGLSPALYIGGWTIPK